MGLDITEEDLQKIRDECVDVEDWHYDNVLTDEGLDSVSDVITYTPPRWKFTVDVFGNIGIVRSRRWWEIICFFLFDSKWKKKYE